MLSKLKELNIPLYSNAFFLLANSIANSLLGFLFWKFAANYYSPATVGYATGYISIIMLIGSIASLGLGFGIIKYLPTFKQEEKINVINSILVLTGLAALIISLIYLVFVDQATPALATSNDSVFNILFFVIFAIVWTWYSNVVTDQIITSYRKTEIVLWKNLIANGAKILLLIFFLRSLGNGIIVSVALSVFLAMAWTLWNGLSILEPKYTFIPAVKSHHLMPKLIKYSLPNYVSNWLWQAPTFIFPLLILNKLGQEASAEFYITWMISSFVYFIGIALSSSLFAEGANDPNQLRSFMFKSISSTLLLQMLAVVSLWFLAEFILGLFGDHYVESIDVLRLLMLASFGYTLNLMAQSYFRLKNAFFALLLITGIPLGSTLAMALFLKPFSALLLAQLWLLFSSLAGLLGIILVILRAKVNESI